MRRAWGAATVVLTAVLLGSCVSKLSIAGAHCPCPSGYCCEHSVCEQGVSCGSTGPGTGGAGGTESTGGAAGSGGAATIGATTGTDGGTVLASEACDTCEFNDTAPPLSFCSGTTVSQTTTTLSAFGCEGFSSASDVANCEALAACLRGTACQAAIAAATPDYQEVGSDFDDPHPCLCGDVPLENCLEGAFTGVCAAPYMAAADGGGVLSNYGNTALPIGVANNLMACDVDSTVAANGLQNCGGVCGLNTATPQ